MALTPEQERRLQQLRAGVSPVQGPEPSQSAIADYGRAVKTGIQSIPGAIAGFADIPFGLAGIDRPVSRGAEALGEVTGFQPGRWADETRARASPQLTRQRESQNVIWDKAGEDWAEGNRLKAAARVVGGTLINPRATGSMILESMAPSLIMGGGAALALKAAAPALSPIAAGALGQAPVIGGFAMQGIDESVDPRRAAQAALGTTIAGTLIAGAGGTLAYRMGLIDPQTAIAGLGKGMIAKGAKSYGLGKRMAGGAISEGVLQELPQEAIDQIAVNWAEDKPLFEGVPRAAYDGMIAGMGMGALFNIIRPSAVSAVDVTQPTEAPPAQSIMQEQVPPQGPQPTGVAPEAAPPLQGEIDKYLKLAMFERQLPQQGAEEYRTRAQEAMQRMEEQLVQRGIRPEVVQVEVARKTYDDLQQKIAFAQQQGQDVRVGNLTRRAQQMESIFGRDELLGPPLTVVERLKAVDEQQPQSLFTSEGQLRKPAAVEYSRIQDMAPTTRATYLMAQLEIARMDAEQGAPTSRYQPLYQALADEYKLKLPERQAQAQAQTQEQGAAPTNTPYAESAIGLAEQAEVTRMAEVRDFVQRVDAQMNERRQQQQQQEAEAETLAARYAPEGPMAESLRPLRNQIREETQQRQAVERTAAAYPQAEMQRREADYDAASQQAEDQRFRQVEMELAINEEAEARAARGTESETVIRERMKTYEASVPKRLEERALQERLANMSDTQFEMFRKDQLGIAPEGTKPEPKKKYPRPAQLNLPGIPKARRRGLEYYDPYIVESYAPELEGFVTDMGTFEAPTLVRNPETGKVTRTPWIQSDWYKERPVKGQRVEQYKAAIEKAQKSEPLTLAQRDIMDYLTEVVEERVVQQEAEAQAEARQMDPDADIPGFDEGTTAEPEWGIPEEIAAPEQAVAPEITPEITPEQAVAPEITPEQVAAPEITPEQVVAPEQAVTPEQAADVPAPERVARSLPETEAEVAPQGLPTVEPGVEIITKADGTPYGSPSVAKARATSLGRQFPQFSYAPVQEGTGWVVRKEPKVAATTENVLQREAAPAAQAAPEVVATPQAAPAVQATPEVAATPQVTAPTQRPRMTPVEAKTQIAALFRESDFPNLSHILGSDWGVSVQPQSGWRNSEHYRDTAYRVADLKFGQPQVRQEAPTNAVQEREAAQVPAQPEAGTGQEVGQEVRQQEEVAPPTIASTPITEGRYDQAYDRAIQYMDGEISGGYNGYRRLLTPFMREAYQDQNPQAFHFLTEVAQLDLGEFTRALTDYVDAHSGDISVVADNGAVSTLIRHMDNSEILRDHAARLSNIPKTGEYAYLRAEKAAAYKELRKYNIKKQKDRAQKRAEQTLRTETANETVRPDRSRVDRYDFEGYGESTTDSGSDGAYFLAEDGTLLTKPLPVQRIKLEMRQFANKLKGAKPNFSMYANQADMKKKNPTLYEKAKKARERIANDFDSANAIGYSFGDGNVVIFSDRVPTTKMLRFILAHESLGHYGFSALFGKVELHNMLNKIWHESAPGGFLRSEVDRMMAAHKDMTRLEAIEEVLADSAARLETSVLAKIWMALQRALKALGINVGSETARTLLNQSRAYVRNSGLRLIADADGHFQIERSKSRDNASQINLNTIADNISDMESGESKHADGRYFRNTDTIGMVNQILGHDLQNAPRNMQAFMTDPIRNIGHWGTRALNEIQTMNYTARDNRGYREFFKILANTVHTAFALRTKYNEMLSTVLRPAFELFGVQLGKGSNEAQINTANQMAIDATLYRFSHLTDHNVVKQNKDKLIHVDQNGLVVADRSVLDKMIKHAEITPKMFKEGFSYIKQEVQPFSPQQRAALEAELAAMPDNKSARAKEIRADLESGSTMVEVKVQVPPRPDITEDSVEYRMYKEYQTTMAEAASDMLAANYAAAQGERVNIERVISEEIGRELTTADSQFLRRYEDAYTTIREMGMRYDDDGSVKYDMNSITEGEKFLEHVNKAILAKPTHQHTDFARVTKHLAVVRAYIAQEQAEGRAQELNAANFDDATFLSEIVGFNTRNGGLKFKSDQGRYIVQHKVADIALFELMKRDAELLAKRTIMGSYVPIGREGHWQVRIQAVDMNGKELAMSTRYRSQMIYMQLNNEQQGLRNIDEINKVFMDSSGNKDGVWQVEVFDEGSKITKPVRLVAKLEVAKQLPTVHSQVNLNEVMTTLSRFNIMLKPEERRTITVGLTAQNAKARSRIRREGTPGYQVSELPKFVSQHLEAAASVVARRQNRHKLDALLDDNNRQANDLWYGSKAEYQRLANELERMSNDPTIKPEEVAAVRRRFQEYHHSFVTKNSQKNGNLFYTRAQRDIAFLEAQADVEWTDFMSSGAASQLRMWTTFAQLGGSAATAALNIVALATNVIPFLSTYNQKNNFGGGFGPKALTALSRAAAIANPIGGKAFAPYYQKLLAGYNFNDANSTDAKHVAAQKRIADAGLTPYEAQFLYEQISAGVMQAALINAMLGSARGRVTSGAAQKSAQAWMLMFSHSEQSARRMTGLAAYRLAKERAIAEGQSESDAHTEASKFAVTAINDTLGEYGMFNRPSIFRGGVQQFIFMYKMFPLTSLLLFKNMSRSGKLLMLGTLMMLSGAKGLPLGDDLMDMLDTIAQRTGLGPRGVWKGSAERTLQEFFNSFAPPGLTPYMMRGAINNIMPINMSDRVSLGNIIPGTGIGLKGVETGREWLEVAGPMASFLIDSTRTATNLVQYGFGALPGTAQTTSLGTIVRDSPVTMFRAFGDALAYHQNGAVTNNRGQIVAEDAGIATIMGRLLGFYPAAAVQQYDTIRTMTRVDGYQKAIVAEFRVQWLKARIAGDHKRAQEITQQVRDWNVHARGTELEIRNFVENSMKSLVAAKMTATERYKKSSPVAQRQHIDHIAELFGATE